MEMNDGDYKRVSQLIDELELSSMAVLFKPGTERIKDAAVIMRGKHYHLVGVIRNLLESDPTFREVVMEACKDYAMKQLSEIMSKKVPNKPSQN